MKNIQLPAFFKKPGFILAVILASFFLRGVFLTALFPIFSGPDEARHYNTIQYLAEPKEKTWTINQRPIKKDKSDIAGYNFSQEIIKTSENINTTDLEDFLYSGLDFSDDYLGKNEATIITSDWHQYNENYPPDIAGTNNLYHILGSFIEKTFSQYNILARFYLIRIFSVLLGMAVLFLCYLIARNVGFSKKYSLLITAILSFQPRFSMHFASITYDDLLIFAFTLFTLGCVLILKNGLRLRNIFLVLMAMIVGLFTKGTAIVLLAIFVFFLASVFYRKMRDHKIKRVPLLASLVLLLILVFIFQRYFGLIALISGLDFGALGGYLSKSLTIGRFEITSKTYWGNLQWSNNIFYGFILYFIWAVETISAIGILVLVFSKKKLSFLPEKKYLLFFLGMLIALQLGIRFFDWRTAGEIGTPGRYFLPNIVSHLILVFCGLSALFKKEKYLDISLKIGLLFMFFFWFYLIIDVVLPRYYM